MTDHVQRYHRHTMYDPLRMKGHALDWSNQPDVYKHYAGLHRVDLPEISDLPDRSFGDFVTPGKMNRKMHPAVSLRDLGSILFLGYGITARRPMAGEYFYYRSVPSAGALYPCEIYLASRSVSDLEDGLYHYAIQRRDLERLRCGIQPPPPGGFGEDRGASVTFYVTAIFYRSIWKYRERAYRYHLLDAGHLVESLVTAIRALELSWEVSYDFDDAAVNAFLGLDGIREACLALVRIPDGTGTEKTADAGAADLGLADASRVSPGETIPEAVGDIHQASSRIVRGKACSRPLHEACGILPRTWLPVQCPENFSEMLNVCQAVAARRSRRNFVSAPLALRDLAWMLRLFRMPESGRFPPLQFVAAGMILGDCDGLSPGVYGIHPADHAVGLVRSGMFSAEMAKIALNQEWMASAALQFFFAAPLALLETVWGPRAYRYAMLSAGRLAHRIYLAATALKMGCCGIGAFYDKDAADLLGLDEAGALLYMAAAGPVKHQR